MNPDFGYLYGIYLGDGCVYGSPRCFQLRGIDKDIIEHTKNLANHHFGTNLTVYQLGDSNLWGTNSTKKSLTTFFEDTCEKDPKIFPKWFHEQHPAFKVELLAGLLDTDGYTNLKNPNPEKGQKTQIQIGFCSTSEWISDVKKLAESLGIRVGKIHLKSNGQINGHKGKLPVFGINLKVSDFIQSQCFFRCRRKQARVICYAEKYDLEYPHRPHAKHHLLTQV